MPAFAACPSYPAAMLTAAQIRAARAWLSWTQEELAERSGVSIPSVKNLEKDAGNATVRTLRKIQDAIEGEGLEIIVDGGLSAGAGPGLRVRRSGT